jgi:hypothetical protein
MPSPRRSLSGPVVALLLIGGCGEGHFEPVEPHPFDPPALYRVWWSEVETCTETRGPFDRVRWYEAEEIRNGGTGDCHVGAWQPPHSIYLDSDYLHYRAGVKHEMVHELLQRRDHDTSLFLACAGI